MCKKKVAKKKSLFRFEFEFGLTRFPLLLQLCTIVYVCFNIPVLTDSRILNISSKSLQKKKNLRSWSRAIKISIFYSFSLSFYFWVQFLVGLTPLKTYCSNRKGLSTYYFRIKNSSSIFRFNHIHLIESINFRNIECEY